VALHGSACMTPTHSSEAGGEKHPPFDPPLVSAPALSETGQGRLVLLTARRCVWWPKADHSLMGLGDVCVRSPRKRRSCVWLVAAILALWQPSPCSAVLDAATAPPDSLAQRRSLLQAYVVRASFARLDHHTALAGNLDDIPSSSH
jgi:hypothetical protein